MKRYSFLIHLSYMVQMWEFAKTNEVNFHFPRSEQTHADNIMYARYEGFMTEETVTAFLLSVPISEMIVKK